MDALVTVATYYDFPAAHLAKTHLESAGIPALHIDGNVLTMHPLLWVAVGGIKVRVRENGTHAGRAALVDHGSQPAVDDSDADAGDTAPADLDESAGEAPARNAADRAAAPADVLPQTMGALMPPSIATTQMTMSARTVRRARHGSCSSVFPSWPSSCWPSRWDRPGNVTSLSIWIGLPIVLHVQRLTRRWTGRCPSCVRAATVVV